MSNKPAIRNQDELLQMFEEKGIDCKIKIIEFVEKAEEAAKNTSDYMSLVKFYKELSETEKGKTKFTEKRTFTNFYEYRKNTPSKIEQRVQTED